MAICEPCTEAAKQQKEHPDKECGCPCQHRIILNRNDYLQQEK